MEAMVVLRDLFEGLTRLDRNAAPDPGRRRELDGERRRPGLHLQAATRTCVVERRSGGGARTSPRACAGWWIRPPPRSTRRSSTSSSTPRDIVAGKKPVDSLGVAAPDDAHRGHHAGHAGALSTRAHGASLLARRCIAPRSRNSANASRAPATRCRTAPSCSTEWLQGSYIRAARNPHYWNNAANRIDGVKFLQIADENAELRAYRAGELH